MIQTVLTIYLHRVSIGKNEQIEGSGLFSSETCVVYNIAVTSGKIHWLGMSNRSHSH